MNRKGQVYERVNAVPSYWCAEPACFLLVYHTAAIFRIAAVFFLSKSLSDCIHADVVGSTEIFLHKEKSPYFCDDNAITYYSFYRVSDNLR